MLFNKKFDLVISLGEDCACATYLRRFNLRKRSFPFDWLTGSDFNTRIELLLNDFKDFLNKEDLEISQNIPQDDNALQDRENASYKNTKNGFVFYHDFKKEVSFGEMLPLVKEKYSRRISRIYQTAKPGMNILFVFNNKTSNLPDNDYIEAQKKLALKFFKTYIYMLILENDDDADNVIKKECLGDNILKFTSNFNDWESDRHKNEVLGNIKLCSRIFGQIRVKRSISEHLKLLKQVILTEIVKIFCMFILNKAKRHEIRNGFVDKIRMESKN